MSMRDAQQVFYVIYFSLAICFHGFLMFLILFKSPKNFKSMRYLLLQTSCTQLTLASLITFMETRIIAHVIPVEVRSYGICRYFNRSFCYFIYMLHQVVGIAAAVSICFMFYYKFITFKSFFKFSAGAIFRRYMVFYFPVFLSLTLSIIIVIRDSQDVATNSVVDDLGGLTIAYLKINAAPNMINFVTIFCTTFGTPTISIILGSRIIKSIKTNSSARTQTQTASFLRGLEYQAVCPLIFYVPGFGFYYYCILTTSVYELQQYFLTPVVCLPTIIDPIVNMYYIIPFRNFIKSKVERTIIESESTIRS